MAYTGANPAAKSPLEFLNPEYQAMDVFDKMSPQLIWHKMFPRQQAQAKSVVWTTDSYSNSTDVKKRIPAPFTPGGEIPHVNISDVTYKTATLRGEGLGFELTEDLEMYPNPDFDEVARIRQRVSNWFAEYMNNLVLNDITDGVRGATAGFTNDSTTLEAILTRETHAGYNDALGFIHINHNATTYGWDDAAANPVGDILEWKECMTDQEPNTGERYPYNLTDLYISTRAYYALINYLVSIDANWQKNPTQFPNTVNVYGVDVHMLQGAWYDTSMTKITDMGLGFDRNAMPATIYYALHPGYGTVGGDAAGAALNWHSYVNDKTRSKVVDMWVQEKTVLKVPKSFMYIRNIV